LILLLNDELRDALAEAAVQQLTAVAQSWAGIRGLVDQEDVGALADLLGQFAALAREAQACGAQLYC
jgi:head-tail adaptor